jgi:hypothetical protein
VEAVEAQLEPLIVKPDRKGPREGEAALGADLDPARRPGVPMAAEPAEEHVVAGGGILPQAEQRERRLHREALAEPTPVFGTAQPYRGVSGMLRRAAYDVPEHYARHWMLLLLADKVDVREEELGRALAAPLESIGMGRMAERVRDHALILVGGAAAGVLLARRLLR